MKPPNPIAQSAVPAAPPITGAEASNRSPNISPDEERLDLIAEAHTRVLDTKKGFEKLVEKAEPKFRPVAKEFLALHSRHEGELAAYLGSCGRAPQEDGSFFGTVNRAVIEMRSWFEEVSDNVMDRVVEGEKHVLEGYAAARDAGQTVEAHAMLARHITEIDRLIAGHTI
ncbi:DUF2383 domain-containing protein [Pararhodobacter sp. SW119]|uniref:DUF2383 domain-containing protein n=1 Tax=Pararhodobacter sp. SW119 TaxID=2780075 RepID=UPI001AE0E86F|nr:DUF2383 domain-containing protein [Pararhodobacter sp. SW119]